jgi:hypothetical protein
MKKFIFFFMFLFGFLFIFISCKKYDDGPLFSLTSKKSRVINRWVVEKWLMNDSDITSNLKTYNPNYSLEFKKDNSYITTGLSPQLGKWDFDSKKEKIILTQDNNVTNFIITRLKKNELWVKFVDGTDSNEIHFK